MRFSSFSRSSRSAMRSDRSIGAGAMPDRLTMCAAFTVSRAEVAADAGRVLVVEDVLGRVGAEAPDQVADLLRAPVHEAVLDLGHLVVAAACVPRRRIDSRVDMPFSM